MPDSINYNSKTDLYPQIKDNKVKNDTVSIDETRVRMKSIFDAAIKNDTVPNHETKEERFQSVFKATARSAALGFAIEAFNENYNSVRIPFDTSLVNISGEVPYKEDSDSISSKVPYEPAEMHVNTKSSVHGSSPSEQVERTSAVENPQAAQITEKQKQNFNEAIADYKISDTVPDAEYLKADGFGSVKIGNGKYNINSQDENGLYYVMDKNGGRTYTNSNGESIRISPFEGQFVEKDAVSVTYSSDENSNSIIYNKDGKPLQGTLLEKQQDGSSVVYSYKYEAGKPVLQSVNLLPNFDEEQF